MDTELGKIATMITEAKEEMTPLQKRLGELGKILSILSLLLCGALFLIAVLQKRDIGEMLITAISLAVAAVPEGLPAVVTICLALFAFTTALGWCVIPFLLPDFLKIVLALVACRRLAAALKLR